MKGVTKNQQGILELRVLGTTYLLTDHAIDKWRERCGTVFGKRKVRKMTSPEGTVQSFRTMLEEGVPLRRENHLKQILKNNFRLSRYIGWNGWIVVVEEGDIIKTVYHKGLDYDGYEKTS